MHAGKEGGVVSLVASCGIVGVVLISLVCQMTDRSRQLEQSREQRNGTALLLATARSMNEKQQ